MGSSERDSLRNWLVNIEHGNGLGKREIEFAIDVAEKAWGGNTGIGEAVRVGTAAAKKTRDY